jgi:hypothetical protein
MSDQTTKVGGRHPEATIRNDKAGFPFCHFDPWEKSFLDPVCSLG